MASCISPFILDTSSVLELYSADLYLRSNPQYAQYDVAALTDLIGERFPTGSSVKGYPPTYHTTIPNQKLIAVPADDWYHRIHITPSTINLGNLLSSQSFDVEVWNGFFAEESLNSISESGTDGIELVGDGAPAVFLPLEAKTYSVTVSVVGPAVVDGSYTFGFDSASLALSVTGKRVVVWTFTPQVDLVETIEFKTDVLKTKSNEQRIALRTNPRIAYQGTFLLDEHKFSVLKTVMSQWGHRQFAFPIWPEFSRLGAVSSGTVTVNADTTQATYEVGGPAILYQDPNVNESVEIESFTDSTITFKLPIATTFVNAVIMPVAFMRLTEGVSVGRDANKVLIGKAGFLTTTAVGIAADTGKVQLRTKDVYLERNAAASTVTEKLFTDVEVIDHMTGVQVVMPNRTFHEHEQILSFDCQTLSDVWVTKQWLYSLKGRQKSFFIPSWNLDLNLLEPLTIASTTLSVQSIQYSLYYEAKDILIALKDGTHLLRHATSGVDAGDGTESIVLDTQIGQNIALDEIDVICFLSHVRLGADRFDVAYNAVGATITIPIREIPE